ncbi:ClpP/crotonase [Lophiostoma macrostomum CBS 122681]|uniref:ClpP/crotonase n=1 Tax=Lophiostoma macrostomum CBS 122681 TaxID=1314788 RepID=A0A6A6T3G7_9PLEO|nr:ClpP/crotonase [Lophiostoma macrostomum CBS 122681]
MSTFSEESRTLTTNDHLTLSRRSSTFTITLHHKDDNPLDFGLIAAINQAYIEARKHIGSDYRDNGACIILTGRGTSVFSSVRAPYRRIAGVPMNDETRNSNILRDAFAPLLLTVLTFPFPTIALINGVCEGGACIISMCHDYRILNKETGCVSFDAIHMGAHFVGMAAIMQHRLTPFAAQKMVLEGYKFGAQEALQDQLVHQLAESSELEEAANELAKRVAKLGAYGTCGLMRKELLGYTLPKLIAQSQ